MQKPQLNNIRVTLKQKLCCLLSLLLSVTFLFSFPLTSYAADYQIITAPYDTYIIGSDQSTHRSPSPYSIYGDPTVWNDTGITSSQVRTVYFSFGLVGDFKAGENVGVTIRSRLGGFAFDSATVIVNYNTTERYFTISDAGLINIPLNANTTAIRLTVFSSDLRYSDVSGTPTTRLSIGVEYESEETGFIRQIVQMLQNLPSQIQSYFSNLGDQISGFFNSLGDRISGFFTNLVNNLKSWFDDVGDWFSELGDRINDFFTNIGDRISGFFEKLWNRIYWGNENGEAEYQPPVFSSSLDDALDKIDEYIAQLGDTNQEIENAKNTSVAYVEQGTTVINAVFGVFPSIVTALVIFGVVFIFCRKVVGR